MPMEAVYVNLIPLKEERRTNYLHFFVFKLLQNPKIAGFVAKNLPLKKAEHSTER